MHGVWANMCGAILVRYEQAGTVEQKSSLLMEFDRFINIALRSTRGGKTGNRGVRQLNHQCQAAMRLLEQFRAYHQQPQQQQQQSSSSSSEMEVELNDLVNGGDERAGQQQQRSQRSNETERRINKAVELVQEDYVSRAAMQLTPSKHAPANERTINLLEAKHLQRGPDQQQLPVAPQDSPVSMQIDPDVWKRCTNELDNGACAGLSGLNGAHIKAMVKNSPICSAALKHIIIDMLNGVFVGCEAEVMFSAVRVLPFFKQPDQPTTSGIRDIKVEEVMVKLAGKIAKVMAKPAIEAELSSIQMGVGKASGVETAIHVIRDTAEHYQGQPGHVIVQVDAENAFGTMRRKSVLEWVMQCTRPDIIRVRRFLVWLLSHTNYSVYYGADSTMAACFRSNEGLLQGGPWGSILYSLVVQQAYERALQGTAAQGVAIIDDFTTMATISDAITVINQLQHELQPFGVQLNRNKTVVYHPAGPMTEQQQQMLGQAGLPTIDRHIVEVLGSALSMNNALVAEWANQQVRAHDEMLALITNTKMPRQVGMLLLRSATLPKLAFLQRTMPPEKVREAMELWQQNMADAFLRIADISADEATPNLINLIKLPICVGGGGLGDAHVINNAAFIASVAASASTIMQYRNNNNNNSTVLARDVRGALLWLEQQQVNNITTRGTLPRPEQDFLQTMAGHENVAKLQHTIITVHATQVMIAMLDRETAEDRARLNSTSARHANAWLTTPPTEPAFMLSNLQFSSNLRYRLGLSQQRGGPTQAELAHQRGSNGWSLNARHDQVKRALIIVAKMAVALVREEPPIRSDSAMRADVELQVLQKPGIAVFVDVMVINPELHVEAARNQLGAAGVGELTKRQHYQNVINVQTQQLMPFVVETCGAIGMDAIAVLESIAEHAEITQRETREEFLKWSIAVISFAIQRGNVEMLVRRR